MALQNDFLPFATGGGANVVSQATYAGLAAIASGYQAGLASSPQLNKTWRQSSIMAAVLGLLINNNAGQPAIDDGTTATLLANLTTAISVIARQNPVLADTGTANTYVVANAAAFTAYPTVSGLTIDVSIANTNTGASTLNVDGLGAKPILGLGLQPLQGNELVQKGIACLMYVVASNVNGGNGAWIIMECTGGSQQVAPATQPYHALQLAQLQAAVGSSGSPSFRNKLLNGSAYIAQDTTRALSTSPQYGLVDMVSGWASGGAVSAGSITQDTAAPVGRTGYAFRLAGVTLTGAGQLSWRYRMDTANAIEFKNQTAQFQINVQHNVGSAINYVVVVRKPTAADNYTSTTVIGTSAAVSVASGTATKIVPFPNGIALGDVTNGIEIEVQVACGAVTTKDFWFTEWQLEEGANATPFEYRPFHVEMQGCERVFQKIGFDPQTYTMAIRGNAAAANAQYMNVFFRTRMRAAPAASIAGTWTVSNCSQPIISAASNNTAALITNASASGDFYCLLNSATAGIILDSRL